MKKEELQTTGSSLERTDLLRGRIAKMQSDNKSVIFVSPHEDDSVFSVGGLMAKLAETNPIHNIVIFSGYSESEYASRDGKNFMASCGGFASVKDFFATRRREEEEATKVLRVDTVHHLGFADQAFREREGVEKIGEYLINREVPLIGKPRQRWEIFFGTPTFKTEIAEALNKKILEIDNDGVVFAPYGFGGHPDHIKTAIIVRNMRPDSYWWVDRPYIRSWDEKDRKKVEVAAKQVGRYYGIWDKNQDVQESAMQCYTSQIMALYPEGVIAAPNILLLPNE